MTLTVTSTIGACNGPDETATATVTGGGTPYIYEWDDPNSQSNQTATGLSAGTFNVSVTDANGCTVTGSTTVGNVSGPTVSLTETDVSCFGGADGFATANVTGGTPPYVFLWDDPSAQTNATAAGLLSGTFMVTVTDNIGDCGVASISISEPDPLALSAFASNQTCGSTTIANVFGGTIPYNYQWNDPNSQINQTATGLAAGVYTVTVTDANGCTDNTSVTVNGPASVMTLTLTSTDETACGACDGTATVVSVINGTSPFDYLWDDPAAQTTQTAVGLCSGTYQVRVIDANNCIATESVNVGGGPASLLELMSTVDVSCDGACDGFAKVIASGGTPPYVFTWPGPTSILVRGSNNEQRWASGLCEGNSTVTVTDASGCSAQLTVTNGSPGPCPPSLVCDGKITIQGFTQGTSFCSPPAAIVSPCPGQPYGYWIRMVNTSPGEPFTYPFTLTVDLDQQMSFSSILASYGCSASIQSTSPLVIVITNPSGSACIVWIAVDISNTLPPGNIWNTTASFTTDCSDGSTLTEAATIHDGPAQCSCDPNDKEVFPAGCGNLGFITNQELTYHVRFQNVGTGPATDVVLRDTLDNDLKLSTLQVLSSSHTITSTQINNADRELVVSFLGINLPAEINDPSGSNGFVTFSIEPKPGLKDGTTIINSTGIFFNGNPPVITKEVINTIVKDPVVTVDAGTDQIILPGECAVLSATAGGGLPPYDFQWSTSETTQDITVCPTTTKNFSVIADAEGCLSDEDSVTVFVADSLCGDNNDKVLICHVPPGNPSNAHEICISANAVIAHLAHGDYLGPCDTIPDSMNVQIQSSNVILTAHPNPLSRNTMITFSVPMSGKVVLDIPSASGLSMIKLYEASVKKMSCIALTLMLASYRVVFIFVDWQQTMGFIYRS